MKICTKCEEQKDFSYFTKDSVSKDGFRHWCKKCTNQDNRERNLRNRDKYNAQRKLYGIEYRAGKKVPNSKQRVFERRLQNKYGLTISDWELMFKNQNGSCAVCKRSKEEFKNSFCVDHDHNTGKVRGLLCSNCNKSLGLLQDNPIICRNAAEYLTKGV